MSPPFLPTLFSPLTETAHDPRKPDHPRVGLIGYGYAGKTFHAPLIQAIPGLALGAVASSDAAKVHRDLPQIAVIADPLQLIASDAMSGP